MNVSLEQIETAEEMTVAERNRLVVLEDAIERGVRSFVETGRALLEVQRSRLYRAQFATFEDYCRARWDMSRARAYQLIDAATVVEVVSTTVDATAPATEAVARELAPLRQEPEQMVKVWETATSTAATLERPVTAADVRDARRQLDPAPPAQPPAAAPEPAGDASSDLRFAHIEEGVAILQMLPAADRIAWPTDEGDLEAVGEAVEWLAKFAPALRAAWREQQRSRRRLHVV